TSGTVTIKDGATVLAVPTLDLAGSATFTVDPFTAAAFGTHSYSVEFLGDATHAPSTGTLSLDVTPAPVTVTANNATKVYGNTVTFAGTEFVATGLLNGDTIGSVTLTSAGAAATAGVRRSP